MDLEANILYKYGATKKSGIDIPEELPDHRVTNPHEWLNKALTIQRDLVAIATDNQLRNDGMNLKKRKERIETLTGKILKEIKVNDLVTVSYPDDKVPNKLLTKRRGPYRVVEL